MRIREKLISNGYSHYEKKHFGWKLDQEKAFKCTDPNILIRLDPLPNIKRM